MTYGIRIKNGANQVQIDGEYRNIAFIRKGTVSSTTPNPSVGYNSGNGWYYGMLTVVASENSTIAYRCATSCMIARATRSGQNVTYQFITTNSASVDYYLFDTPPPPVGTYGLNIWNGSGQLVFSSDYKYLKLIDTIRGSSNSIYYEGSGSTGGKNEAVEQTYTYPSGRTYAVVQNMPRSRLQMVRLSPTPVIINGIVVGYDTARSNNWSMPRIPNSTTVQISRATNYGREPLFFDGIIFNQPYYDYLVIDVTNY